jgi:hypothetical protein
MHLTPSFRLGEPENGFAMKSSMGTQFSISSLNWIKVWTEVGVGLVNSQHEVVVGLAYPFEEVGS